MPPFRIYKICEDGLRDLVEIVPTLGLAKERVQQLADLWPAEYVILDNDDTVRVRHSLSEGEVQARASKASEEFRHSKKAAN